MLVVVYDSLTGLGKKFAQSLELPSQSVWKRLEGPCILVSRNSGAGQIPWTTKRFIRKYRRLVLNKYFPKLFSFVKYLIKVQILQINQRLCHQWQSEALSANLLRGNG